MEEHLKYAPECGWAVIAAIEESVENGSHDLEDPISEKMQSARQMTFGSKWPHENKRGWSCKTQKVLISFCPVKLLLLIHHEDGRCWLALLSDGRERRLRQMCLL